MVIHLVDIADESHFDPVTNGVSRGKSSQRMHPFFCNFQEIGFIGDRVQR
jgi:hypothetical protein